MRAVMRAEIAKSDTKGHELEFSMIEDLKKLSRTAGTTPAGEKPSTSKQAYEKPAFRHEGVFETMALSCGKISGTQGACSSVKKLS